MIKTKNNNKNDFVKVATNDYNDFIKIAACFVIFITHLIVANMICTRKKRFCWSIQKF